MQDYYNELAAEMFGLAKEDVTQSHAEMAKAFAHVQRYGVSGKRLRAILEGKPPPEGQAAATDAAEILKGWGGYGWAMAPNPAEFPTDIVQQGKEGQP